MFKAIKKGGDFMEKENRSSNYPDIVIHDKLPKITRREKYRDFEGGLNGYSLDQMLTYQRMLEKDGRRS